MAARPGVKSDRGTCATVVPCALALSMLGAACGSGTPPPERSTRTSPIDGMPQAFVPAGEFLMGSDASDPEAEADEFPAHAVLLDAYWIDVTEVTNGQFAECVAAGGCTPPQHSFRFADPPYRDHPVLGVAHPQATAYCAWAERRLPTEAEWERAARGDDRRLYPWGNQPPEASRANFSGVLDDTAPVASYPAGVSPYGAFDMAGNVWEWVADAYQIDYYAEATEPNLTGGESSNQRVIRGGSWTAEGRALRAANRYWAFPLRNDTDGFRCAQDSGP